MTKKVYCIVSKWQASHVHRSSIQTVLNDEIEAETKEEAEEIHKKKWPLRTIKFSYKI
jgi:hypothetical protein